ncbi:lycopene cyclase domain-containing protein [Mangrovibacterium sp.]|uniref:lycopene cyclase domain-containing protein n=1 Tax=Mangrovibacterium sp. TaxID=1961364 RepID=UPI003565DF4E
MQLEQYTYAGLLIASIAIPLALSFDKKVHFYTRWKYLIPSIIVTAIVFLVWDVRFTEAGIWSFNPNYLTGIYIKGLPVEEWLFFFVIPYSTMFIYEVLKAYLPNFERPTFFAVIIVLLVAVSAWLSYYYRSQLYTFFNFLFLAVYLAYVIFRNKFKPHLTKFFLAYLIGILPFLIVNGILTSLPVVEYHPEHIIGLRIINIPIEDFGYFFLLLLMNTTIYETLKEGNYY